MQSELPRAQGHHYDQSDLSGNSAELNSGVEGHQEKTSMMKRVRAKAKKIKNSLTSHGPDHDHEHSHSQDESEENEDVEMVEDPEIHGAPIEAEADKGAARASGGQSATGGTNSDSPSMVTPHYDSPMFDPETRPFVQRQADEDHGKHLLREDQHELPRKGIDTSTGRDVYDRENQDQVGGPNAMENRGGMGTTNHEVEPKDPEIRAHPSNDQIKTIDPAAGRGSEEAEGITPVVKSFNEMGISEEKPKPEQRNEAGLYTGSHNQFDPEPVPSKSSDSVSEGYNAANPRDMPSERSDSVSKGYNAANPRDMPSSESSDSNPLDMPSSESSDSVSKGYNAANLRDMPSSKSSDSVSKGHNAANPRDMPSSESSDSVPKSYNAANPQDMPKDVSNPASKSGTYTEKITAASATAAYTIAGTAQSAKTVIASKIGQMREPGDDSKPREGNKSGSVMGTAGDYANRIAATVTGTLAPVYGKVVGVGSGATSKVSGSETTQESGGSVGQDKVASGLGAETTQESGGSVGQDKVVSGLGAETTQESGGSVGQDKVLSRKSGEEDKALSSESFSKSNGEKMEEVPSAGGGERSISQMVSDAVHEREPEESKEKRPMGKVTESEEVAKRLGTGEEGSGVENVGSGGGVVSKFTSAIGSWLGGQGGRAQSTPGTTLADDNEGDMGKKNADAKGVTGERRLQE